MLQRLFLLILFFTFWAQLVPAQDKCGTPELEKLLQQRYPQRSSTPSFENWMAKKKQQRSNQLQLHSLATYTIPVVVHVVHNGEAEGTGANIPLSQINRQLEILNQDFQSLNTAQIESLPPAFRDVAGNANIEFKLALQDPEGLPTSGVVRIKGSKSSYAISDDLQIKELSHWPSAYYLNLYAVPLAGNLLGYAQFPETNVVDGLDDVGFRSEPTDGVVISYRYFGEGGNASADSKGRTATHEIGHYLGLRHIWGDKAGCETDDYVNDTPLQDNSTSSSSCPSDPLSSCGSPDMYQNFMDYTPDECMALFTGQQVERMHIVLENSPDRQSLLTSPALQEPEQLANDAGINQLDVNILELCSRQFQPTVRLRNYGDNPLQSVELEIYLNGRLQSSKQLNQLNLATLEEQDFSLDAILADSPGRNLLQIKVVKANGANDLKEVNNLREMEFYVPSSAPFPFAESFDTSLEPLYAINPDHYYTWQYEFISATGNAAAGINFYDYEINIGAEDLLLTPKFDLSNQSSAYLSFRLAYAQYIDSQDGLSIYVSTDCSESLATATKIYEKSGRDLATAPNTNLPFSPASEADWRTEILDLSAFIGKENVQLIFVGQNAYGNNLYLDDVSLMETPPDFIDIAVSNILFPSVVSAESVPEMSLQLRNNSYQDITGIQLQYQLDGGSTVTLTFPNLTLSQQEVYLLNPIRLPALEEGEHLLEVKVQMLEGRQEAINANNQMQKRFVFNQARDIIPLRLHFANRTLPPGWTSISPYVSEEGWQISNDPAGPAVQNAVAEAQFTSAAPPGATKWLVSPILDLSDNSQAGLQFLYQYPQAAASFDALQLRVSTDGGYTYPDVLFDRAGAELGRGDLPVEEDTEWQKGFINLNRYLGEDKVRIAFVAIKNGGNPIYLDNIELIPSSEPVFIDVPLENSLLVYPNPSRKDWKILFNLLQPEAVTIRVVNSQGRVVKLFNFPRALNQPETLDTEGLAPGMYILHIRSNSLSENIRVVLAY